MGWRSQNNDSLNRPRWLNSTGLEIQSAAALATMRPSGLLLRERVFAVTGLGSNNSEELLRDRQKCKGVSAHRAFGERSGQMWIGSK